MDIVFLRTPTELCLEVADLDFVRQIANQRMNSGRRPSMQIAATPGATPVIQPVLPPDTQSVRRRGSRDSQD